MEEECLVDENSIIRTGDSARHWVPRIEATQSQRHPKRQKKYT